MCLIVGQRKRIDDADALKGQRVCAFHPRKFVGQAQRRGRARKDRRRVGRGDWTIATRPLSVSTSTRGSSQIIPRDPVRTSVTS